MIKHIHVPFRFFSCILMLISISCAVRDRKDVPIKNIDEFFSENLPANEPGAAILIMKNDSILFAKGYGLADLVTKDSITTKTLFNIGSVSKTFVANGILKLQEQGKLSVEDSLLMYFPDFTSKSIAQKVKIKHLLTHTSGLPDNRQVSKDTVFYLTAKDAENWHPVTQAEELLFEPGSHFQYSNPAFNGLALIIEKVSGMKWQTFIKENIMKPSGMSRSTITDGPHPEAGVSHGYVKNHGEWTEDDYGEEPTFPASGNGGVWSSVEELAKYELALRNGIFLSPETVKDSRTIKKFENWSGAAQRDLGWSWFDPHNGWSWFVNQTQDSLTMIGHTGSQGGFVCNYVTIPESGIFFVVICNSPRDITGFSDRIMQWLQEQKWL